MTRPIVRCDLHTHSDRSDGTETPTEVVGAAALAGLRVLALTDHDTGAGWDEAGHAASMAGITLLPGLELSCSHAGRSVHLLAYQPDVADPTLRAELGRVREHRERRLDVMVARLAEAGYRLDAARVLAEAAGGTIGRPHVADALVAAGYVPDRDAAFARLLHAESPYYVAHYAPQLRAAVLMVRAAGGVPVLAHPFASGRGAALDDATVQELAAAGLAGLEVHHRDHGPAEREHAAALADRYGLLVTGSSDYHGTGKRNRIGEHTTDVEVVRALVEQASGTPLLGAPPPW